MSTEEKKKKEKVLDKKTDRRFVPLPHDTITLLRLAAYNKARLYQIIESW